MPRSQSLLRLVALLLFSDCSRALDPRVRHSIESHIDDQAPSSSFKRSSLRERPGATRLNTFKQQFLDLGLAGLGTYFGGVLQGVVHVANDMLGNEWTLTPDEDAAAANATSNTKYVVAQ